MDQTAGYVVLFAVGGVLVLLMFVAWIGHRYKKVGPNEALIVYGRGKRGGRIVVSGGTFIWPLFEQVQVLSLEIMTIDVTTPEETGVYTIQGVPIFVDGVAQIKVDNTEEAIKTAAEQFLGKSNKEIEQIALQTLQGHLRAILGTMTVEEIYKNRDAFAQRVQEVAAVDLAGMGLRIVSFTIKDIRDPHGYLEALGKPRTAQVKRDAVIGEAEAQRDATARSAQANQEGQTAKFLADTKIAEAQRDYEINVAQYTAAQNKQKAEADLAYDLQKFKTQQLVEKEQVQVEVVQKQMQAEVQKREIERKQLELEATVNKPADAERYRIQTLAEAEREKRMVEATGEAEAIRSVGVGEADANKARGLAEAEVVKAKGLAEAEVIKQKGFAEAEAMMKKAEAWQKYNQAAIVEKVMDVLPAIAGAIAQPLAQTERIVMINTGGDSKDGIGASRITRDVSEIISQLPPVLEALSGVDLNEMLDKLPGIGTQTAESEDKDTVDASAEHPDESAQ